jgi:5-(aminomethyl)-3-furanmethanol phosphate kinase
MWVIKLDGDLLHDPVAPEGLRAWLSMLATFGGGRVTVVAGAGAFAQPVRMAQRQWGLNDLTAHNMMVLAMAQGAEMLHALEPRLRLARQEGEIRRALHGGACAVWQPYGALRDAPDLLTSTGFDTDHLTLWLAHRLNAERVVVVRSTPAAHEHLLDNDNPELDQWRRKAAFTMDVVQATDVDPVRQALVSGR